MLFAVADTHAMPAPANFAGAYSEFSALLPAATCGAATGLTSDALAVAVAGTIDSETGVALPSRMLF